MKYHAITLYLLLVVQLLGAQQASPVQSSEYWPSVTVEAKPWTRWWWMGSAVNEVEVRRLLKVYADKGFGGVEITPIYGVKGEEPRYLDFLSTEWMKMLSVTIEAAARNTMEVDMNNGTGWPFGGPHISSEYAAKNLLFYSLDLSSNDSLQSFIGRFESGKGETLLALSGISETGKRVNFLENNRSLKGLEPGAWKLTAATQKNTGQQVKRAAPGGEGHVFNHFSKEATLHYLQRFQLAMNGLDPGLRCFFNDSYELSQASSTADLFEVFKRTKGYDLSLYLRELSGQGDLETIRRIKFDYRDVLGTMILENFTETWTNWAHSLGIYTRNQAHGSPSNLIDLYSTVDIPEVETFNASHFPFLEEYLEQSSPRFTESNRLFRKLASSAAHIMGGNLVSCETFTWLNEHFRTPLYQCKPEIDNLFTEGINHLLFHGTAYSPATAEWPGWLFYASVHMEPNNPQWEHLGAMNQYITRCQSILQQGSHTNDILVYWSPDEYFHQPEGLEVGLALHSADSWIHMPEIDSLYEKGYQFDFISDRAIEMSEVRDGIIYTNGKVPYSTIVLPPLKRIRLSTFKKLLEMSDDGADIVFSNMPELVTGFHDFEKQEKELGELISSLDFKAQKEINMALHGKGRVLQGELQRVLDFLGLDRETLVDQHIKSISRRVGDASYYFLANHEKERVDQDLEFKYGAKHALFMNPMSGELSLAESSFDGASARVHVVLEQGASTLIYFTNKEIKGIKHFPYFSEETGMELSNPWLFTSISGIPEILPDTMLPRPVFWSDFPGEVCQRFSGTAAYSTTFYLDSLEAENYLLRFERVEASARVFINETELATLWSFPFEVEVGPYLIKGKNQLRVEVSNLGANAIRYLDQTGVNWKRFHNINIVNFDYQTFDASDWDPLPSGLSGTVELIPLKSSANAKYTGVIY